LGSGGRTIGEKLGVKLMVPFYDKALIQQFTEDEAVEIIMQYIH
jgi:hypothetical protein